MGRLHKDAVVCVDEVRLQSRIETTSPDTTGKLASKSDESMLIVSPYDEPGHRLDLSSLDVPNQLMALALTELRPATIAYATVEYDNALNWAQVFDKLKSLVADRHITWPKSTFYIVEFRSQLKVRVDGALLFRLDKESHREATASGGLLKYWYGKPDADRRNLATCLWRSKEDAIAGGRGPIHTQARMCIPQMYDSINVHGFQLVVEKDVGGWSFHDWREQ